MGTYLSTPVLDKHTETGSDLNDANVPVRWAVVDMQGWRKSMEDAHVARTDVGLPGCYDGGGGGDGSGSNGGGVGSNDENDDDAESTPTTTQATSSHAKVFAVFDGHGGAEVARFCQMYLVPVLTSQGHWKGDDTAKEDNGDDNDDGIRINGGERDNDNMAHCIGRALVESFHALDRLIDGPNHRGEIERWRTERPPPYLASGGQGGTAGESALEVVAAAANTQSSTTEKKPEVDDDDEMQNVMDLDEEDDEEDMMQRRRDTTVMDPNEISEDVAELGHLISQDGNDTDESEDSITEDRNNVNGDVEKKTTKQSSPLTKNEDSESTAGVGETIERSTLLVDDDDDDDVFEDSLSEEQTDESLDSLDNQASDGVVRDDSDEDDEKEERHTNESNDNDDGEVVEMESSPQPSTKLGEAAGTMVLSANDAISLFQKLLHMNSDEEEEDDDDDEDDDDNEHAAMNGDGPSSSEGGEGGGNAQESAEIVVPTKEQLLNPPTGIVAPSISVPTRMQNGRKICNLPDHPVHAGCTSIVAVIVGRTLVVANAGDSRGVICRAGGLTEPLSFDHKPLQNREMNRITNAGGFVNQFGRVNGNLNLSRSIGDLKYKQVPGIPPAEQMITAEPDILCTTLRTGDEFIVLGCDGIWDCLSNEECVKYVYDRINVKSPHEIGTEMLDEIVSADPRASQGIGGDNMTVMIVDLLPHSRPYSND